LYTLSDSVDIEIYSSEDTTVSQTTTGQTTTYPSTMEPPEDIILYDNAVFSITLYLTLIDKVIVDTGRRCGILDFEPRM